MKKAQSPLGIVVGLSILVVLLFVFVFVFRPPTTAQVISEADKDSKNSAAQNFLENPFELRAWVVSPESVQLDIKNIGSEDYLVKVLEISACSSKNQDKIIKVGESKILSVDCSLKESSSFESEIILVYTTIGSAQHSVAKGKVSDVV